MDAEYLEVLEKAERFFVMGKFQQALDLSSAALIQLSHRLQKSDEIVSITDNL